MKIDTFDGVSINIGNRRKVTRQMADPYPSTLKGVLSELRDINKEKRRTAVMKLGMIGGDEALRALIRTVENEHEDLIVRGRAALMLGQLGDTRAVMPLINVLNAPGYQISLNAVQSLGKLGDIRAIDPLLIILNNSKDRLHDAATAALKRLGYLFPDDEAFTEVESDPTPEPELS